MMIQKRILALYAGIFIVSSSTVFVLLLTAWNSLDRCTPSIVPLVHDLGDGYIQLEGTETPLRTWSISEYSDISRTDVIWLAQANKEKASLIYYVSNFYSEEGSSIPPMTVRQICKSTISPADTSDQRITAQMLIHAADLGDDWHVDQYIAYQYPYYEPVIPLEMSYAQFNVTWHGKGSKPRSYWFFTTAAHYANNDEARAAMDKNFRRYFNKPFTLDPTPDFTTRLAETHEGCIFKASDCSYYGRFENDVIYIHVSTGSMPPDTEDPAQNIAIWHELVALMEAKLLTIHNQN